MLLPGTFYENGYDHLSHEPDKDPYHQRKGIFYSAHFGAGEFLRPIIKTNKLITKMKKLFLFAGAVILSTGVFAQAKKAEDVLKF